MKLYKKTLLMFLFLGTLLHMNAQNYYDQQWKKVAENYQKGLYKSNLPIILEIKNHAIKDNNSMELINALKAQFGILRQTHDDTDNDENSQFFKEIVETEKRLKGADLLLLKVLETEFISDYFNNNEWRISQRTNIESSDLASIETWSKLDFKNYLSAAFENLEKQKLDLQKIKLSPYNKIFQGEPDFEFFPTLNDWYATKYVRFLKDSSIFTKNELKDNQYKVQTIYDELIKVNEGNPKLYFLHQKLSFDCEKTHCKDKVQQLENLYQSNVNGDYKVLIAAEIMDHYSGEKDFLTALKWAEKAQKDFPKSQFLTQIENRENQIKNSHLSLDFEQFTLPNKPIHVVAQHKNVSEFSLKIYEVTRLESMFEVLRNDYYNTKYDNVQKKWVRTDEFSLPNKNDFDTYKTSLEIKPLKAGLYIAEMLVNGDRQMFWFSVTNQRVIYQDQNNRRGNLMFLIDRNSGKIMENESLNLYEIYQKKSKTSIKTDANGSFVLPQSQDYQFLVFEANDHSINVLQKYGERFYDESRRNYEDAKVQIFLDRAIYRPGQIVYFKAIATKIDEKSRKQKVASNVKLQVTLLDANDEEVAEQLLTTNDFGSINGSFPLPKGKLNGQFSIQIENADDDDSDFDFEGYKDFKVEEYKRPKFEVNFEPVKDEYKYGETIELKGVAKSYSGVPLSDTSVNYEIKKQNIRWKYFWWYPRNDGNENSILGETKTNEKGEFFIKLDLKKDQTLDGIQVDNYEINASVTDINGETQSAETDLKVASVSHYIEVQDASTSLSLTHYFTDQNIAVKVETKNYNGQDLKKSYHAKLMKLQEPERIFRDNFKNEIQDLPILSKADFIQKFPHDYFDQSELPENWKVEKVVKDIVTLSGVEASSDLNLGKLEAGTYKLLLYNIEGKDTIKTEQRFEVWNRKKLGTNKNVFLKVIPEKSNISRSEKAAVCLYSAIPNAEVLAYIQNGKGETKTEKLQLKNGFLKYEIPVPVDENITQLNVQFLLAHYNDVEHKNLNFAIKSVDNSLKIETITFRDKLEPGQKEKWTVKVTGNNQETINAELLANMYDLSLDQFAANYYSWSDISTGYFYSQSYDVREGLESKTYQKRLKYLQTKGVRFPEFNWFDAHIYENVMYSAVAMEVSKEISGEAPGLQIRGRANMDSAKTQEIEEAVVLGYSKVAIKDKDGVVDQDDVEKVKVRTNLNETAFFYPDLKTDKDGNISFEFTSPEALTKWKLMFLAHTQDARAAVLQKEVVTQKEFSVTPNYPRFLREGDEISLQSKLSNLTKENLSGSASLHILDAFTNEDISKKFSLNDIQKSFNINAEGNSVVDWILKVPKDVSSIILKVVATSTSLSTGGKFSDGEQQAIAVLPNRMLVTDAVPVFVKEGQTKTFILENLKNNTSKTATNFSNTLELSTNPIWEIMFALPSLKEDQNNSADVIFNKWFADVLAAEIFKANPKMKTVFEEYQSKGLLKSNLEKNQELKQLLLEETPWVLESKNEEEQMTKLARLFDANSMRNSINQDWEDFMKLQNSDGGFSWVQGYPSSYYTSLYILKNLGRINEWLKDNIEDYQSDDSDQMIEKLVKYLDREIDTSTLFSATEKNVWTNYVLDYLDSRHYFEKEFPLKGKGATMKSLVMKKAVKADIKDFTFFGLHRAALLFDDYKLTTLSKKLLTYLKETSTDTETQGVYWKQNLNDWGWYSSKTVNHAGALEAFQKLTPNDVNFIEEMKIWLVTQKEVNSWGTSRGTAEVIFTILNSGKSWTSNDSDKAEISWGEASSQPSPKEKEQSATGYYKKTVISDVINKDLAQVTIKKSSPGIVQGGLFWQYYEDLDQIKSSESYISITKELYKKVKTENGEKLEKITPNAPLKIGDKVTVRMILNTDRNMEFIHIKDMRAAGFEPLNVISQYQWKNNLGYYESTKDASTNFYIQYMPKGKYVFEYDYICNAAGSFSNGMTTLQNYYAPQMNAHTKGDRVKITE